MKHLKTYKIFEAIAPTFRAGDFMDMKEHIKDITQDLSDEGFEILVNLTSKSHMGYVSEFIVRFERKIADAEKKIRPHFPRGQDFSWDEIKDRVTQIISSVNEETNNEFVFEIQAFCYDSFNKYTSLDEVYKNLSRGGRLLREMTSLRIRFINKVINKM
jgi:hypothetical protein